MKGGKGPFRRLYDGETEYDFVNRWKLWFAISGAVILLGLISLFARGLNLGIDFEGGNVWQVPARGTTVADATDAMEDIGLTDTQIQLVGDDLRVEGPTGDGTRREQLARTERVVDELAELTGAPASQVTVSEVGPSWGREISEKAVRALIAFLVIITIYITLRFELKMALATLAALLHDILVVVGIYSLFQLPVTPATVIAILTILGFSIYDGIVVFDRVDENTRLLSTSGRMTYTDMVNLSLNEVLMRSLNTSITALLPILSVLVIGSFVLGASTLEEFGLALFIGQLSGAYSSLTIASPALAMLKEREPRYRALRRRLAERGESKRGATRAELEADLAAGDLDRKDEADDRRSAGTAAAPAAAATKAPARPSRAPATSIPPRPRKKGKRR